MRLLLSRTAPAVTLGLAVILGITMFGGCGSSAPSSSTSSPNRQNSIQAVGLKTDRMNYYAAPQHATNWCWAASTQMTLSAVGIDASQEEIVASTFVL